MEDKKVVVVGAGFGGLASAALLAKNGFEVTLLEKNEQCGGRARVWQSQGFVFDMGPSWYLMPAVFEMFFKLFGKRAEDYYQLTRLDPNYRVFFGDKKVDVPADRNKLDLLFNQLEEDGSQKLNKYLKMAEYQYEIAMRDFMYRPYTALFDFFNWKMITEGTKLHIFESIDRFARRYFQSLDIRKILEYTTVFLGGSPKNTPALYSIMSHVDFNLGVWYPQGGIGKLVEAFERLAKEMGVKILLNQDVYKLEIEDGKVCKIITQKDEFAADVALVNADYHFSETSLVDKKYQSYPEKYWQKRKMGPSAFLVYLGLSRRVPGLCHHNLYLDASWDEHFKSIFEKPQWPKRFSYYVSCPSRTDKSVAPQGSENLFILVPVASGLEDNAEIRNAYFDKVVDHLEKLLGESLRDSIVVKRTFAHEDFKSAYHAFKGTALGLSHTLFQTAVFRPSHRSKKVKNLYYTGSYTHPGIGVPMVLISAQIASELIKDYK